MNNKKTVFSYVLVLFLLIFISSFRNQKTISKQSNHLLEDSIDYPSSDLYLLKDINNQPLLTQITKYKTDKSEGSEPTIQVHLYPSSKKANDSILSVEGLVFDVGQNPDVAKFSVLAEAISMTKADSLAEIKRFEGVLYKNGKKTKPVRSCKGLIQPRCLKLYSKNYENDTTNKEKQIAKGNITSKYKLHEREELVFKKSHSTLKLIILEDRGEKNYVLKLDFDGENKFNNNPNVYIQLIGYAGEFSIPLGTFVSDVVNPTILYLPIEKELVEKLITGKANYSLKFQNPVEYQFSEIKLNQF
ncbi:hypothetical protein WAF17_20100 [Bernardetia sp. ABR2-2B]|uniref:hypothetical protein n=1 Tax=Bernardetia sp. ABR2-2B TaxID=3127472 RepID=UPI0030CA65D2